jgi:Asp-tRNA(Asn)/Glu-tRNA(Gln) amidotransferase A subunit family amidase
MNMEPLESLTATAAAAQIREGRITARELVEACLARIDAVESTIGAWTYLDRAHALAQAEAADDVHRKGGPHGPLHGVPVGIKDIFDTHDMPTEDGTPLHAGRTPRRDATAVARLREAGAIILGKTVTTELAYFAPGKTRNPHDPTRTPGGSSSGSAAAVAAHMVPLAIGSQTNGSVIRPAAYCGVVGYKPTHGLISRKGALRLSRTLDQVGVFARTVEDAALIAECMIGYDADDPDTRPLARPPLVATAMSDPPLPPRLAFVPTPMWSQAEPDTQAAFEELAEALDGNIERIDLPSIFERAIDLHRTIMETDMAINLAEEFEHGADKLSPQLCELLERGRRISGFEYGRAIESIAALNAALDELFFAYEAFVTPAATGAAPAGLETTGSPIFCTPWTLCGVPAITLPMLQNNERLPVGVQLVGARNNDARLLRTARWLTNLDLGG